MILQKIQSNKIYKSLEILFVHVKTNKNTDHFSYFYTYKYHKLRCSSSAIKMKSLPVYPVYAFCRPNSDSTSIHLKTYMQSPKK